MERKREEGREALACGLWLVRSLAKLSGPGPPLTCTVMLTDLALPQKVILTSDLPSSCRVVGSQPPKALEGQVSCVIQTLAPGPSWIHSDRELAPD